MKISQALEYAIIGLLELKKTDTARALGDIAERAKVPESFLAKIFQKLHRAGVMESRRGKGGGFVFLPKSAQLTVWDIHEIIEGPTSLQSCVGASEQSCKCHKIYHCTLQEVWREAQNSLKATLQKWTLEQLSAKDVRLS